MTSRRWSALLLIATACALEPSAGVDGDGSGQTASTGTTQGAPVQSVTTTTSPAETDATSPADTEGSTLAVPSDLITNLIEEFSQDESVAVDEVRVARAEAIEWPDGSLGCPEPGILYTQATVRGFWVELEIGDQVFDYRAASDGEFRLCTGESIVTPTELPPAGGEHTNPGGSTGEPDY